VHLRAASDEVSGLLEADYQFEFPRPINQILEDVNEILRQWTERGPHPMHFGQFRSSIDDVAVLADKLVARCDPNLATQDFSPGANRIEQHTLAMIARRFGPEFQTAHFTSGGQEANHTAVIAALTHHFPQYGDHGLRALSARPVFYLSEEAHHSFDKIAHATGLGRSAARRIRCDHDLRMDRNALCDQIDADRCEGFEPLMLIGTAGTTGAGAIDPLGELARIARQQNLWYHVDAAWGGAAVLSDRLRPLLSGIDSADSITCDAHKWMSVPVGAGMFFCRHPSAAQKAFDVDAPYLPSGEEDPYRNSMQWSRRFIGLKLFMTLAARSLPEIARRIEHQSEMSSLLRENLQARGWTVLNDTPLPVVCFWHPDFDHDPLLVDDLISRLRGSEEAWVSTTLLRGTTAFRACITNGDTQRSHIELLVTLLERERLRISEAS
jgi:glutamate/tyrosine decarboxylase-like PLP-dependent enzyme